MKTFQGKMMDSPFQEVPGTPFIDNLSSFHANQSPAAIVPSTLEVIEHSTDQMFNVPNTPNTPGRNPSLFVPRNLSQQPSFSSTPRGYQRQSTSSIVTLSMNTLREQVVPSTPQQSFPREHVFSTPKSTPSRSQRWQVSMETRPQGSPDNTGASRSDPTTVIIDETGDHHHRTKYTQKGCKRKLVARQRRSMITRNIAQTCTNPDFLDQIQ